MRLVMAVLRPTQLEAVRQALAAVHVTRLTICDAQGHAAADAAAQGGPGVTQQSLMEIAVNDDFLDRTVDTLAAAMRIGEPEGATLSDRLFVLPMEEAVQIYRDVRGQEAV
jgi:nitrogen regulatory protein P-II 1